MTAATATTVVACPNCGKKNRVPAVAKGAPRCANCHKQLPWIVDADDASFADVVERADVPVLVDMWASWCSPCRMVSPALERVARDLAGQVKLAKVDVDRSPTLSQRFTVQSVPTLMVMRAGQVVARQAGAAPAATIRAWVEEALGKDGSAQP